MREPEHYWLIPGFLMGGAWPLRHLDWLELQGISMLINLTQRSYQDGRFRVYQIPIAPGHPPEIQQTGQFCRLVAWAMRRERRIYVHCEHGCGRTGTLLACYLVYHERCEPDRAIARLRAHRSCSVESDAQEEAVSEWAMLMDTLGYRL